jgi:hypothetical protein
MDFKIFLILFLIIFIGITCFLYVKKIWIFENKYTVDVTSKGCPDGSSGSNDLDRCMCPIKEEVNGNIQHKNISNYELENKHFKVRQDLMPYWSDFGECSAYGIKNRKRVEGSSNDRDFYDSNSKLIIDRTGIDSNNTSYYEVNSCDLIPCEHYGFNNEDENICRNRSLETQNNYLKCNPIITFSELSDINNACSSDNRSLPLHNVDYQFDNSNVRNLTGLNYSNVRGSNAIPVLIGVSGNNKT